MVSLDDQVKINRQLQFVNANVRLRSRMVDILLVHFLQLSLGDTPKGLRTNLDAAIHEVASKHLHSLRREPAFLLIANEGFLDATIIPGQ